MILVEMPTTYFIVTKLKANKPLGFQIQQIQGTVTVNKIWRQI